MVTKRIRSEYMKKFKDPKWETYGQCYEDLVKYRLSRRLLEQAHNPWFWDESGSDTESSGRSTPRHRRTGEPDGLQEPSQTEADTEQPEQPTVAAINTEAYDAREAETSHIPGQEIIKLCLYCQICQTFTSYCPRTFSFRPFL